MNKEGKNEIIKDLTERFNSASNFYLADASSLSVADVNKLRRICHKQGVIMKVAKNTFIRKALEATGRQYDGIIESLNGPTSIMFTDQAAVPAKVIKEFRKTSEKPVLKAAYIDTAIFIGDNTLDQLAKLKTKQELLGEIVSLLQSPMQQLLGALQSGGTQLSGILKTLGDKKEN